MKNTPSTSATLVPIRRRLTSALLVFGLTLATIVMTARPVEAAAAVVACHTQIGTNFFLNGVTIKLMAWRTGGFSFEVTRSVLDNQGCAFFYVPPQFQGDYLYTVTNSMDVGHFYGSYYNGYSYDSYAWITPNWYGSYSGIALPGNHVWYLQGWVDCQTCRWVP
jgi:hypothetical protein